MGRRLLLNLLLVAVAFGLALFIYLQAGKTPETGPGAISAIDPDTVSSIRLTRLQAEPVEFSKRDGRWFIHTEPELPADDFQVSTLLALADKGWAEACADDPHLLEGPNVHAGKLTYYAVGRALGIDVTSPQLALKM